MSTNNESCESLLIRTLNKVDTLSHSMVEIVTKIEHMREDIQSSKTLYGEFANLSATIHSMSSSLDVVKKGIEGTDDKIKHWEESQKEQGKRLGKLQEDVATLRMTERIIWGIVAALFLGLGGLLIHLLSRMPDIYYYAGYGYGIN